MILFNVVLTFIVNVNIYTLKDPYKKVKLDYIPIILKAWRHVFCECETPSLSKLAIKSELLSLFFKKISTVFENLPLLQRQVISFVSKNLPQ